jgi:hypothetical protein
MDHCSKFIDELRASAANWLWAMGHCVEWSCRVKICDDFCAVSHSAGFVSALLGHSWGFGWEMGYSTGFCFAPLAIAQNDLRTVITRRICNRIRKFSLWNRSTKTAINDILHSPFCMPLSIIPSLADFLLLYCQWWPEITNFFIWAVAGSLS